MINHLPAVLVIMLLLTAFLAPLLNKIKSGLAGAVSITVSVAAFIMSVTMTQQVVVSGPIEYHFAGWNPPIGIAFLADELSVFTASLITGIGTLILIYSLRDLHHEITPRKHGWYYALVMLLMGGMIGMSLTSDLFNLFVFIEITSITACAIIAIKDDISAIESSFRYLILSTLGSGTVLFSIALLYMVTGHLNIGFIHNEIIKILGVYPKNIYIALGFMTIGFGVKSALLPLHVWLPDAHSSAPSPSSAFLSGLVLKAYVVAYIKLLYKLFGLEVLKNSPIYDILLVLGAVAMIYGSYRAIGQADIKRLLAYSSVAQMGYIFLGVGLGTEVALLGGLFHVLSHAVTKSMLFLCAGSIIYTTEKRRIPDLAGIGYKMPWTMGAFAIGAFSMAGFPLLSGFFSKWYLTMGSMAASKSSIIFVIVISSLLNMIYYFPIIITAFFKKNGTAKHVAAKETPWTMTAPVVVLAFAVVVFGITPLKVIQFLSNATAGYFN